MIRVGWLCDRGEYMGGAEMNAAAFFHVAPKSVKVVDCPPDDIDPHCDIYVIHNCTQYSAAIIPEIKGKRIIKVLHDVWNEGDAHLRSWLLLNATLTILVSPDMTKWLKWRIKTPFRTCPSMVNLPAKQPFKERNGRACWIGRLHANKGLNNAAQWAIENKIELDVYGFGDETVIPKGVNYKGELKPAAVLGTMREYNTFVFLPDAPDACPRVIFEAYHAGCKIITNKWQGATYWIKNNPDAIHRAGGRFWDYVSISFV